MALSSKKDKENNIQTSKKVKAAPDFSKLHKQWDAKLQKGKAVNKKPLTEVQPFQLTRAQPSKSISSSGHFGFVTDPASKEQLLSEEGVQEIEISKPQRTTIGGIPRSSIPRSSFLVNNKRNSLHAKDKPAIIKFTATPTRQKQQQQQQLSHIRSKRAVSLRSSYVIDASSVVSNQYSHNNAQGFVVDFKADPDALNSILNEKGIERLPKSPPKHHAVQGTTKRPRTKGRVVPFSRPSAAGRLNDTGKTARNETTLNAAKERWSIFSRDSYSTKPDLKEWLQKMIDDSKAKRAAATEASKQSAKSVSMIKNELPQTITANKTLCEETSDDTGKETTVPAINNNNNTQQGSFLFKKTLIGYQGDEPQSSTSTTTNTDQITDTETGGTESTTLETNPSISFLPKNSFDTPMKTGSLPAAANGGSAVRSILKAKSFAAKTQRSNTDFKSPAHNTQQKSSSAIQRKPKFAGTPVRLSAYARQQLEMGLPLPKEYRYEGPGERNMGPSYEGLINNTSTLTDTTLETKPKNVDKKNAKTVRWADGLKSNCDFSESNFQSPQINTFGTNAMYHSIRNHQPTPFAVKTSISTMADPDDSNAVNKTNNSLQSLLLSPNKAQDSRVVHQIKYVMPAEQPLEKVEKHFKKPQVNKSLFQQQTTNNSISQEGDSIRVSQHQRARDKPLLSINATNDHGSSTASNNTTVLKSWAQVLGEELECSTIASKTTQKQNPHKDLDKYSLPGVPPVSKQKKKRNKKRISIIEKIYGDSVQFIDSSPDQTASPALLQLGTEQYPQERLLSSGSISGIPSSLNSSVRPVPSLDKKLIGDLMSFNESDKEEVIEEHRFFKFHNNKKTTVQTGEVEAEQPTDEQPFQSTMLDTPSLATSTVDDVVLIELTPVLDEVHEHSVVDEKQHLPEAPCKKLTKARTPYKQEMLDLLERTITASRQQRSCATLDCTIGAHSSELIEEKKSFDSSLISDNLLQQPVKPSQIEPQQPMKPSQFEPQQPMKPFQFEPRQPIKPAQFEPRQPMKPAQFELQQPVKHQLVRNKFASILDQVPDEIPSQLFSLDKPNSLDERIKYGVSRESNTANHHHEDAAQSKPIPKKSSDPQQCILRNSTFLCPKDDHLKREKQLVITSQTLSNGSVSLADNQDEQTEESSILSTCGHVPNIRSPSMRLFSQTNCFLSTTTDRNNTGLFSGTVQVANASSSTLASHSDACATTSINILRPSIQQQTLSQSSFDNSALQESCHYTTTATTVPQLLVNAPTTAALVSNSFTTETFGNTTSVLSFVNNKKSSSSDVTIKSMFQAPPLFSSLSRDMKFSTSNDKEVTDGNVAKQTHQDVLRPSMFASAAVNTTNFQQQSPEENFSPLNNESSLTESVLLNESDICVVHRNIPLYITNGMFQNEDIVDTNDTNLTIEATATDTLPIEDRSQSTKMNGSAFRCVLPNHFQLRQKSIKESYQKLRVCAEDTPHNVSMCVDTEVAMYTKIGDIRNKTRDLNEMRDGALNVVSVLLTFGDSKHFVPIESAL